MKKTLTIAVLAAVSWIAVTAACLSEIASVPANLAVIEARQKAPVAEPPISVAQANCTQPASELGSDSRFGP
jgi:hypothetical protein